jgi:hypothetical protein
MNSGYKVFKISKKFKPCPVEDDDELFPNGIFEFNVTKMQLFINQNPHLFPLTQARVTEYSALNTSLDDTYIASEAVDVDRPVILAEIAPDKYNLIDGHHRLEKARKLGIEHLPAFKIPPEQHMAFLTTSAGYTAYIDYWNQKVKILRRWLR